MIDKTLEALADEIKALAAQWAGDEASLVDSGDEALSSAFERAKASHDALNAAIDRLAALAAEPAQPEAQPVAMGGGELWSFIRSVMSQGATIQQDYMAGHHKTYEHYSARLDVAARERAEELSARLAEAPAQLPRPESEALTDEQIDALRFKFIGWEADKQAYRDFARAAIRTAATNPEGYILVPKEPTEAMLEAGYELGYQDHDSIDCWKAMLAAAPTQAEQGGTST